VRCLHAAAIAWRRHPRQRQIPGRCEPPRVGVRPSPSPRRDARTGAHLGRIWIADRWRSPGSDCLSGCWCDLRRTVCIPSRACPDEEPARAHRRTPPRAIVSPFNDRGEQRPAGPAGASRAARTACFKRCCHRRRSSGGNWLSTSPTPRHPGARTPGPRPNCTIGGERPILGPHTQRA
jgi:hypothetical protein